MPDELPFEPIKLNSPPGASPPFPSEIRSIQEAKNFVNTLVSASVMCPAFGHQHMIGRPPTGKGLLVGVRMHPNFLKVLDEWREKQKGRKLSRPEAIRQLRADSGHMDT